MASTLDTITVDCADAQTLADLWCAALGLRVGDADEAGEYVAGERGLGIHFQVVPEPKGLKNRVHLDPRPSDAMAKEVERLKALGAPELRYVEEGGGSWTVMQDPEGNESCVLRGPEHGWSQ